MARILDNDIEAHYWGTRGVKTAGAANVVGLEQYRDRQATTTYPAAPSTKPFEDILAQWFAIATLFSVIYSGMSIFALQWYESLSAGIIVALAVQRLFSGPLRIVMTMLGWFLSVGILGFAAYLFYIS